MLPAPYQLVVVEWVDSYGCAANWGEIDDDTTLAAHHCYSVGWLVRENSDALLVVPHLSPENKDTGASEHGCGDMTIPRCAVRSITYLSEE